MLPLSIFGTFSILKVHPVYAYLFYLHFSLLLFSFYLPFNNVLWKAVPTQDWPVQLAFLRFVVCTMLLFFLTPCNTLFFTHSVHKISPSFSSTEFQNFHAYFYLLSEASNFQDNNNLCFKHCISLVYLLNLIPVCWWRMSSFRLMLLVPWKSWIQFRLHKLHQIAEIFYSLQ